MGRLWVRHRPESAAEVRHTLASELAAAGAPDEAVFDAEVISSELIGNAVSHARDAHHSGHLLVRWHVADRSYTFSVTDGGSDDPAPAPVAVRHAADTDTHGRGLSIVSHMADAWGVTTDDDGSTTVWARRTF